ncbi:MAG: hypothetical protein RLZ07_1402 [Pseudomonadota bacterium]|jgi:hypothetical protein
MVDYYALISPTIEPLAGATPEERQVVYRRLVDMLDQQLRAADPPRTDKSILKERIELESAIRRVERHILARQKTQPTVSAPPQQPPAGRDETILSQGEIPTQTPLRKDIPGFSRFVTPKEETPIASEVEPLAPEVETVSSFEEEPSTLDYEPDETLPSVPDESSHDKPPLEEQTSEVETEEIPIPVTSLPPATHFDEVPVAPLSPREFFARPLPAATLEPDDTSTEELNEESLSLPNTLDTPFAPAENEALPSSEADESASEADDTLRDNDIAPIPVPEPRAFTPTTGIILAQQKTESSPYKGPLLRLMILLLVLLALMAAVAGVAEFLNRNAESELSQKTPDQTADAVSSPTKFVDRLPAEPDEPQVNGTSPSGTAANEQANSGTNPLATRAVFIEEQAGGIGDAKKTEGRVTWKLDTLTSGTTGAADLGVRATIDLSDAGLTASLLFRKNRDLSSANAYLIEVNFQSVGDAPNGKIRDISIPELRPDEKTRGVALAGIPVPVSDNVFLVGLNGLPADMKRNIELIQKQNWFFIQVRFTTGKRALLLFEKGKTGDRVFEDAIQAWK